MTAGSKNRFPGGHAAKILCLLCLVLTQDVSSKDISPLFFVRPPLIRRNPNPAVPLAAIIEFITSLPVKVTIAATDDASTRILMSGKSYSTRYSLPVLGLRPGVTTSIDIVATDESGNEMQWRGAGFRTDPLPPDFPRIETTVLNPERMEPGVTLFDPIRLGPGSSGFGLVVAVNEWGEPIWYYRSSESISDARRMDNGNLLLLGTTGAIEIDMLGNTIDRWYPDARGNVNTAGKPVEDDTFHHEIYETRLGDFFVLSTELRRVAGYPTSDTNIDAPRAAANVVGDVITEFAYDGSILHSWHLLDLLDPLRIGFDSLGTTRNVTYPEAPGGTRDWSHGNAVIEDKRDGSIIVSTRHQDAIVKIDRKTGGLVWILGTPDGWNAPWDRCLLKPVGALEWPYHQHAPEITPQGTILVFDNGNFRHRPFDGLSDQNYSRAVEYSVNEQDMTVSQVWSYGGPGSEMFFSSALGDADWLPATGNVLITDGARVSPGPPATQWARIVEVTHTPLPEKVFELIVRDAPGAAVSGWSLYRSERLPSLYPGN